MDYTLHQLQVFYKIAEIRNITKAAEELHLTQPAVSIQLKNFQNQFDVPLYEVIGRKIHITDFGKEIAAAAEKILQEVHAINYRTLSHKGLLFGKLKISIVSTGKYVMPFFLSSFMAKHNDIELSMDVTNKTKVVESLENNEVDFALVSILPSHLVTEELPLLSNQLYLVGKDVPEISESSNSAALLKTLPLIYREKGSGTRYMMEKFINDQKIIVRKKMELTSNEAVKQAVIAGLGYSIMPLIGIRNELNNGILNIINIDGLPLQTTWNLVWLKGKNLSPVARAFLDYIRKEKDTIVEDKFGWVEV